MRSARRRRQFPRAPASADAPVKPELDRLVTLLAEEYGRRPLSVINEIYADQRGLQNLADAFRFKGPK